MFAWLYEVSSTCFDIGLREVRGDVWRCLSGEDSQVLTLREARGGGDVPRISCVTTSCVVPVALGLRAATPVLCAPILLWILLCCRKSELLRLLAEALVYAEFSSPSCARTS